LECQLGIDLEVNDKMTSTIEQAECKNPISIPTSVIVATCLLIEWVQEQTEVSHTDKKQSEGASMYFESGSDEYNAR
jgi:hypothetical protein